MGEIVDADETNEGLEVHARFDLEDPVARKAWRLVKSGAIDRLSIGYSVRRERRAPDGATELLDVNLKEVSLVMNPANERARVLAIKSEADDDEPDVPSDADQRRRLAFLTDPELGKVRDQELGKVRDQECKRIFALLTSTEQDEKAEDALRKQCEDLGIPTKARPPIQIASFEI